MRILPCLAIALVCALPGQAQDAQLVAAAKSTLAKLQSNSFDAEREYCGLLGALPDGRIAATRPRKGRMDSCKPREFSGAAIPVASFHTHGAYDIDADAEVPSSSDILADHEEGLDGFVSTPGGRFWFIDGAAKTARQICGVGCLPQDPDFKAEPAGSVRQSYTLEQIKRREAGG
jgi:hypothetical protein